MKQLTAILILLIGLYFMMIIPSCDYGYLEPLTIVIPDTVRFSENVLPIFNDDCGITGCHVSGGVAPNLTAQEAYDNLWLYDLIDTTDAPSSLLYERLTSTSKPMPPTGNLKEDKIQLILAWIAQGGRNN